MLHWIGEQHTISRGSIETHSAFDMDHIEEIVNKILISLFPSVSRHCHRRLCSAAAAAVPPLLLNSFGNRFHYSLDYCTISNSIYLTFIQVESFISDLLKYSYTAIWCWLCLCFVECIWLRIWTETLQRIPFFPTKSSFQGNEKKSVFVVWKSTPIFLWNWALQFRLYS